MNDLDHLIRPPDEPAEVEFYGGPFDGKVLWFGLVQSAIILPEIRPTDFMVDQATKIEQWNHRYVLRYHADRLRYVHHRSWKERNER